VAAHTGERARLAQRRGELRALLGRALGRVESQLKGLERTRQRAAHAAAWQHQADLLLSHLHAVEPRADSVQVTDWVNGEPVELTLALDPALSGPRNAEALYERARKARRAAEGAPSREPELGAEHERLTALAARLAAADSLDELDMVAARLDTSGAPAAPRAARPRTERERWLARLERHVSADGYTILVGRNATESEGLLSRIAAPSDLWLHVRGAGSGHVIIRTEGRPEAVPAATLEEAARWAARHSRARHSDLVPVVYTQRRYVTKVTGGAAGKVVYRHEKLILVDPT
jgi:predicted ribosome quality control (RQC) complex YloA/Tae2 family protein